MRFTESRLNSYQSFDDVSQSDRRYSKFTFFGDFSGYILISSMSFILERFTKSDMQSILVCYSSST